MVQNCNAYEDMKCEPPPTGTICIGCLLDLLCLFLPSLMGAQNWDCSEHIKKTVQRILRSGLTSESSSLFLWLLHGHIFVSIKSFLTFDGFLYKTAHYCRV